ncbi:hypothetical protein NA57DRAFT_55756 [Rhizodiscina lignyota]|uniref:Uncharacterized protein n=1 Tax=Rhizodiscina lignyota TaxID=1504668 RepID=A0A9P4IDX2_9PEZI|nr:hypothetical protein NA57DRAFT_55756 [Rhizodiscina lignyota]
MRRDYLLPGDMFLWTCLGVIFFVVGTEVGRTLHRLAELPEEEEELQEDLPKPAQNNDEQVNAISNESLALLATHQNPNIRNPATQIFIERFLGNDEARAIFIHDLTSPDTPPDIREKAIRALRLLHRSGFGDEIRDLLRFAEFGDLHEQHARTRSLDAGSDGANDGDTDGSRDGSAEDRLDRAFSNDIRIAQQLRDELPPGWSHVSAPEEGLLSADGRFVRAPGLRNIFCKMMALVYLLENEEYQALEAEEQIRQIARATRDRVDGGDADPAPLYPARFDHPAAVAHSIVECGFLGNRAAAMLRARLLGSGLRMHERLVIQQFLGEIESDDAAEAVGAAQASRDVQQQMVVQFMLTFQPQSQAEVQARPRPQEESVEEVARRRRRREAMVLNEGDRPVSERDIIQRRRTDEILRGMRAQGRIPIGGGANGQGTTNGEANAGSTAAWGGFWRSLAVRWG